MRRWPAPSTRARQVLAFGLLAASGFSALGYQIVWTQQCALWLGHEAAAVLAVVAAFFAGLAIGALALGARIERSHAPAFWYAGCEAVIGLWSLGLVALMPLASDGLLALTGAQPSPGWQWAVAFCGTFLLLLPATAAMGATLPAMERVISTLVVPRRAIGALYAGNTLGAVAGVLAAAFWLVPAYGLARTAGVCAALNLVCAGLAWVLLAETAVRPRAPRVGARHGLVALAATGVLGIGYEVLAVRVLSQVCENTVYTFAMLLAVYLVGTALGAAAYERRGALAADGERLRDRLIGLLAAACLVGGVGLWNAEALAFAVQWALGPGMAAALTAEALLAVVAFLAPTLVMGALFAHLATQARETGVGFDRALGVNTLGAAIAPLLFGVLLIPTIGPKFALLAVAAGYLALLSRRAWRAPAAWLVAGATAALALWAPPLAFVDVPEGGHVVSYRDGVSGAVSVVEDASRVLRLRIDNREQEGSSSSLFADARQALLPLLLHPAPRHALFLGLGTGMTASAAAEDPQLEVDAVELLPEVVEASRHFTRAFGGGEPNPRLHLIVADARRFVRTAAQRYDVIVSDNFHPARSGSGSLYTVEHFRAVQERLEPDGLFCQWLPLHQLDLETLRSIARAFVMVYPDAAMLLATNSLETPVIGLVAHRGHDRFYPRALRDRRGAANGAAPLPAFGLVDEFALLGSFIGGPAALARFADAAPVNTDDHPVVAYAAPRQAYAPDSLPRDRLTRLLHELRVTPAELVGGAAEPAFASRLSAYWRARERFLQAGRDVQASGDVRRMLAQVGEPLLAVLRISPDFRPAYDPLLRMATALAPVDARAARLLLEELDRLQPARPEAAQALLQLAVDRP